MYDTLIRGVEVIVRVLDGVDDDNMGLSMRWEWSFGIEATLTAECR